MAFPITAKVKFRTLKTKGADGGVETQVLKELTTGFDKDNHKVEALVDLPATIADLKAGNSGAVINGVPVKRKDGYAPYFGVVKRNYPLWKHGVHSAEWELVKNYGEYFLESKPE